MILLLARLQHKRGIHKTYFSILLSLYLKSIHYLQWGSIKIRVCVWDVQIKPIFSSLTGDGIQFRNTSYLSALDFWNFPLWNMEFDELDFFLVWTWVSQAAAGRKIEFKLSRKKNETIKLENFKNQVQIDRGQGLFRKSMY